MAVKRGIDKAVAKAVEHLEDKLTKKLTKKEEMEHVASISANNDPNIGKLMADAFEKVGKDGVITVEEGKTSETDARVRRGHAVRQGLHLAVLRLNTPEMKWELENVLILIYEKKLVQRPRHAAAAGEGRPGRASRCSSSPRTSRARRWRCWSSTGSAGCLEVCAVKAPGFGDRRKAMLGDIAVLTGGQFISEDLGLKLENVTLEQLGTADQVSVEKENSTIIDEPDKKREKAIKARVQTIRTQMDQTESEYDKEKFSRAAGEADRRRGDHPGRGGDRGRDEADQGPRRGRPARHPGGGRRGHRPRRRRRPCCGASPVVEALAEKLKGDERIGAEIVARALEKPVRTIAENCGVDGAVVADEVADPRREEPEHRVQRQHRRVRRHVQGRASSTRPRVTRSALQNAASIAGLMLTTEVMVTKIDEDDKKSRVTGSIA